MLMNCHCYLLPYQFLLYSLFKDKQGTWNDVRDYINNNSKNSGFTTQEKVALIKAAAAGEFNQYSTGNNKGIFDTGRMSLNDSVSDTAMTNWLSNYRQQQRQEVRTKNQQDVALFMAQTGAYIDGGWQGIIDRNPNTFNDADMQIYAKGRNITSTMSPNGAAPGHPAYRPDSSSSGSSNKPLPVNSAADTAVGKVGARVITMPIVGPIVQGIGNWFK